MSRKVVEQVPRAESSEWESKAVDIAAVVAGSADVVLVTDSDGRMCFVSEASRRLFGWEPSDLLARSEDELAHPDDVASLRSRRADASPPLEALSYRFRCSDGSFRWTESTSRRIEADGSTLIVSGVRDVSERQERMRALEHQARLDPLTGVANRTVLMDRLRQGLHRLDRVPCVLAVLYLDLDRFKVINDSLGHRIGDSVLLQLAERLTHHLRPVDTLARLGGDEFVVVAEGLADEHAVLELADRVIEAGRRPFVLGDDAFVCTVSVGIAWTSDSQRAAEELLHEADLALYRAKDRGRDRAEVFDEQLRVKAVGRLVTERMVRRALDENRLVVQYQPIIDLRAHRPVGAEALVRIDDEGGGLLLPATFLDVAEESGMLTTIDEYVLADALRHAAEWRAHVGTTIPAHVAINVTARHLADAHFHSTVTDLLDAHGLAHDTLQIEVTERVLMEASNSAMTSLRALRDSGVSVGLDDFGTGYSSLAYLRQFPLDFVKIDKSFIDDLATDDAERAIVLAIIELAHALRLTVVAEGVETRAQQRILGELDCDRAQGFLFAPSVEPEAVEALLG